VVNIEEIKNMSTDELNDSLLGLKKEAFNLRFQQANGQLENTSRMRDVRKDIARVSTVLREQQTA